MNILGPGNTGIPIPPRRPSPGDYRPPLPVPPQVNPGMFPIPGGGAQPGHPAGARGGHIPQGPYHVPFPQAPANLPHVFGQGLPGGGQNPLVQMLAQFITRGHKQRPVPGQTPGWNPNQMPGISPGGPYRY